MFLIIGNKISMFYSFALVYRFEHWYLIIITSLTNNTLILKLIIIILSKITISKQYWQYNSCNNTKLITFSTLKPERNNEQNYNKRTRLKHHTECKTHCPCRHALIILNVGCTWNSHCTRDNNNDTNALMMIEAYRSTFIFKCDL